MSVTVTGEASITVCGIAPQWYQLETANGSGHFAQPGDQSGLPPSGWAPRIVNYGGTPQPDPQAYDYPAALGAYPHRTEGLTTYCGAFGYYLRAGTGDEQPSYQVAGRYLGSSPVGPASAGGRSQVGAVLKTVCGVPWVLVDGDPKVGGPLYRVSGGTDPLLIASASRSAFGETGSGGMPLPPDLPPTVDLGAAALDFTPKMTVGVQRWDGSVGRYVPIAGTHVEYGVMLAGDTGPAPFVWHTGTVGGGDDQPAGLTSPGTCTARADLDLWCGQGGDPISLDYSQPGYSDAPRIAPHYFVLTFPNGQVYDSRLPPSYAPGALRVSLYFDGLPGPLRLDRPGQYTAAALVYDDASTNGFLTGRQEAQPASGLWQGYGWATPAMKVLTVSGYTDAPPPSGSAPVQVVLDAHRQPRAVEVSAAGEVRFLASENGGHTYNAFLVAAQGKDPSLVIGPRSNLCRVLFDGGGLTVVTAAQDGERGDWGAPSPVAGAAGTFPACRRHPDDPQRVLMVYLDGGSLMAAINYEGGDPAAWSPLGTVDTGQDFAASGGPGLCWLGETPLVAYRSGANLLARTSADGGKTWGLSILISGAGPHKGISAVAAQGVFLVAATEIASSAQRLWSSSAQGLIWDALNPPPADAGAGLGVNPFTGRIYWGTCHYTDDWGAHWPPV